MNNSLLSLSDYRELLRNSLLTLKKDFSQTYSFQSMANACRVQKAYLSNVLLGKGHLNSDQIYLAAHYLAMNEDEINYILDLSEWLKTVSPKRKEILFKRIETFRKNSLKVKAQLSKSKLKENKIPDWFYLDVNAQLIHMFLTIKKFAKRPEKILDFLSLNKDLLNSKIQKLADSDLIIISDEGIKVVQGHTHLGQEALLFPAYLRARVLKALEFSENKLSDQNVNFTVLFSSNENVRRKIHENFLDFIKTTENLVLGSPEEEVFILNFHFLKIAS